MPSWLEAALAAARALPEVEQSIAAIVQHVRDFLGSGEVSSLAARVKEVGEAFADHHQAVQAAVVEGTPAATPQAQDTSGDAA